MTFECIIIDALKVENLFKLITDNIETLELNKI